MEEKTHWLDQPRNIKLLWRGFLLVLVLTVLAELVVPLHPHFEIDAIFGFNAWFGLLMCAFWVVVALGLAQVLKRPESYYGKDND
ncbi:hypothetical protein [Rhodoferax sp.]|uniref:hypothetical protein n=1 Tax=Rhodoferax sp. TaxID=50421 RepID=UPI0025E83E72|nr:hypothetical protein [Rhodoferax sp.]